MSGRIPRNFLRVGKGTGSLGPPPPLPRPLKTIMEEVMRQNNVTQELMDTDAAVCKTVKVTAAARLKVEQLIYAQWSSNINLANAIKAAKEEDDFTRQYFLNDPDAAADVEDDGWF